jgi:hypothetical protein
MGSPLKVVVAGKHDSTCRSHIKYVDNTDLKTKTNDLGWKDLEKLCGFKKNGTENRLPM